MTIVTLNIPSNKMSTFMKMLFNLGLEKNVIISCYNKKNKYKFITSKSKIANDILLFGWEFFNNELEFE